MLVSGEIENVPLLDVLQVVSYSKQTGVLTVEGVEIRGAIVFEQGAVVRRCPSPPRLGSAPILDTLRR